MQKKGCSEIIVGSVIRVKLKSTEVGIYKRKQEGKKQELDQKSEQENKKKKHSLDQHKGKNFLFFLITFFVEFLFSFF